MGIIAHIVERYLLGAVFWFGAPFCQMAWVRLNQLDSFTLHIANFINTACLFADGVLRKSMVFSCTFLLITDDLRLDHKSSNPLPYLLAPIVLMLKIYISVPSFKIINSLTPFLHSI
jgi:hypothetical protein